MTMMMMIQTAMKPEAAACRGIVEREEAGTKDAGASASPAEEEVSPESAEKMAAVMEAFVADVAAKDDNAAANPYCWEFLVSRTLHWASQGRALGPENSRYE